MSDAITVQMPGYRHAHHGVHALANDDCEVLIQPIGGIIALSVPGLAVHWSPEQWAAVIPALVAALPDAQRTQVIEAVNLAAADYVAAALQPIWCPNDTRETAHAAAEHKAERGIGDGGPW